MPFFLIYLKLAVSERRSVPPPLSILVYVHTLFQILELWCTFERLHNSIALQCLGMYFTYMKGAYLVKLNLCF